MGHTARTTWLTTDVSLLETDAQQVRLHLGWLLEDLALQHDAPGDLAAQVGDCLEQLARLDEVLDQLRQTTAHRAQPWQAGTPATNTGQNIFEVVEGEGWAGKTNCLVGSR